MKALIRWLQHLWFQIKLAWPGWLATVLAGLAVYWALRVPLPCNAEIRIGIIGVLLQALSVSIAVYGVERMRTRLGKKPAYRSVREYFGALFRRPKDYRLEAQGASYSLESADIVTGLGRLTPNVTPLPPIEVRMENAERRLHELTSRFDHIEATIRGETATRVGALDEERRARTQAEQEQRRLLDEALTGDALITVAGLFCLLIGIILTGIPQLLAHYAVGG